MKKKKPYNKRIKKIKKECDDLWSKVVRARAGKCELCGGGNKLDAHHVHGRGLAVRWDLANGIGLCYQCHRNGCHSPAAYKQKDTYEAIRDLRGFHVMDELEDAARGLRKWNLSELEKLKEHLQTKLKECRD